MIALRLNQQRTRLAVEVRIQQDVSSEEANLNPCHSKLEPSDKCLLTKVVEDPNSTDYGQFQFRDDEGNDLDYFKIKSDVAKPNLVNPYRRKFLA